MVKVQISGPGNGYKYCGPFVFASVVVERVLIFTHFTEASNVENSWHEQARA